MYCRNCGKEIPNEAVVCVGCGVNPKVGRRYCQNCGTESNPNADICKKCGIIFRIPNNKNENTSKTLSIVGICFSSVSLFWALLGGICCGWGSGLFAIIGFILSLISIILKKDNTIGWIGFSLAVITFILILLLPILAIGALFSLPFLAL